MERTMVLEKKFKDGGAFYVTIKEDVLLHKCTVSESYEIPFKTVGSIEDVLIALKYLTRGYKIISYRD